MLSPSEILSAFDLHSTVRGSSGVLAAVGSDNAPYRAWSRWAASRGRYVVTFDGEANASTVVREWCAVAFEGTDVVNLIASFIATRNGDSVSALEYRLKNEWHTGTTDALDILTSDDAFLQHALERLLGAALTHGDLWVALDEAAQSFGGDVTLIPRAVGELIGWERAPVIAFVANERSVSVVAETAARIVERALRLPVAVCINDDAWDAYVRDGIENHAKGLLRAGLMRVSAAAAERDIPERNLREHARALLAVAKQRSSEPSANSRARSEAEKLVYRALEANPYTRGHFELNGTLDVVFGTRLLEVDIVARGCSIALEIDGYFHFLDADAYRRDREKDLLMQQKGYLVVRVLAEDAVEDLENVVSRIVSLVLERTQRKGMAP